MAIKLYNENRLSCHHSELLDVLRHYLSRTQAEDDKRFEIDNAAQMDYLRNDVQTCTFLVRDSAGNYSFRHKSFMEFFVAQTLSDEILNGSVKYLEGSIIPGEIKGFLIDFLKEDPPADKLTNWLNNTKESILRDNLLSLIAGLKINISNSITETDAKTASESDLHLQFLQGNTLAFDEIYRRYYPSLLKLAINSSMQTSDAEEIVNDAFLSLLKNKETLESVNHIRLYLAKYVSVKILDYSKEQNIFKKPIVDTTNIEENVWKKYDIADIKFKLEDAIEKLSTMERFVVNSLIKQNKTAEEIARELGISIQSVRNIRFRAINKIRGYLNNREME